MQLLPPCHSIRVNFEIFFLVLDSKNNNRVETLNSNKETPEYDTLFSSIRDSK